MTSESYDVVPNPAKYKKVLYGAIVIAVIGVAVLIAGGVMLGIGIHKANQKSTNAPSGPVATSTVPSTGSSSGSTLPNGGSSQPAPSGGTGTSAPPTGTPVPDLNWADTLIVFDASFNLLDDIEKKLVDPLIIGPNTTRFETIAIYSYATNSSCTIPFGTLHTYDGFHAAVQGIQQFNESGSITSGMTQVAQNVQNNHPNKYLNTIFFTSTSDDADVASATSSALLLQAEGSLVVVAVGSADKAKLAPLTNGNETDIVQIPTAGGVDFQTYAQQILGLLYVPPTPTTTTSPQTVPTTTVPAGTTTSSLPPTGAGTTPTAPTTLGTTVTTTTTRAPLTVHTTATHNVPTSTSPGPSTATTSAPFLPCQSLIAVIADATAGISADGFAKQQTFIASILNTNINHYERVMYGATSGSSADNTIIVPFDDKTTLDEIQNGIKNTNQTASNFDLVPSMQVLVTDMANPTLPEAAIVFVSDTSDASRIQRALAIYENHHGDYRLTFVLTGTKAVASALASFNATILTWTDFSGDKPTGWDTTTAFGCSASSTTTTTRSPITVHTTVTHNPVTTTTTAGGVTTSRTPMPVHTTATHNVPTSTSPGAPTTVTTTARTPLPVHTTATHNPVTTTTQPAVTTPAPYFPCKTQITFAPDTSNSLTADQFKTQLTFISTIIGKLNYPARIGYANGVNSVPYGSYLNITDILTDVGKTTQTNSTYDLRNLLRAVLNNVNNLVFPSDPDAVVVFISNTSHATDAASFVKQLNGAKLTFVLLGANANANDVASLSNNTIAWTDLTKPQPDSWTDETAKSTYGCDVNSYAVKANSFYRFFDQRDDTPTPCNSQVVFSADVSNTLSATQFRTQIGFVSSAIAGFSDLTRIAYSYGSSLPVTFGTQYNLTQIQEVVASTSQTTTAYSLRNALRASVSAALSPVDAYAPVAIVVFISDTSNIGGIDSFLQTIRDNGIVLTLVLMGDKAIGQDVASLNVATLSWADLSQNQPDNWNDSVPYVYACEIVPTTTTTTTRAPLTVHTTATHNVPSTTAPSRSPVSVFSTVTYNTPTTTTTRAPLTVHTTATHNVPTTTTPSRSPITVHTTVTHNVPTTTTTRAPLTVHTTVTHNVPTTTTTTRAPLTVHTTVTHNVPTTTTTRAPLTIHTTATHNVPTTTPNLGDYQPCRTQLIFALDDTSGQSDAILTAEKAFLSKAIGAINYPNRIALIRGGSTAIPYFNQNTTTDFQNAISATQKSDNDFVLRGTLTPVTIAGALPPFSDAPQAAIIFVSNTSPSSITGSQGYLSALKFFNVKVTLVVYGPNANGTDVANLGVDVVTWADPTSQDAPDNWDTISRKVYGCESSWY